MYNQPQKVRARTLALKHAVEVLTIRRTNGAIVDQDYVARVKKTLTRRANFDAKTASRCSDESIKDWELFWQSKVGVRSPADLTVAYLAGPEPMNDFLELVQLGVHPNNIYGFESENKTFNEALKSAKLSRFPLIKIIKMPLDRYLQAVPMSFDIVYFDACGPFPSLLQATLRTVANIFRYQRLNPLGVLITNFSMPNAHDEKMVNAYSDLVAAYLYPKQMLESGNSDWNLTNGAVANSMLPKVATKKESFFHAVKADFPIYYGQYVTRQLFDLGSFIVPISRLSTNGLWQHFFKKTPEEMRPFFAHSMKYDGDDEFFSADYIIDSDMNPLGWTLASLAVHSDPNYLIPFADSRKLLDVWGRELGGFPQIQARDALHAYLLLRNYSAIEFLKPTMVQLLKEYAYLQNMHMFCDLPTRELALFPTLAQFAMPYHYNVAETRRYKYLADGKATEMFLDVIPFDTCRYIYDWLPSAELVTDSFDTEDHQLIYRFALDGLLKHSIRYNNEYVFGGHVVGVNEDGYTERLLTPRETIE